MAQTGQSASLLEVLKKKMRAMKEELETANEQREYYLNKYNEETRKKDEVIR